MDIEERILEEEVQEDSGYATYQAMVSQVSSSLSELEKLCTALKLEENSKDMERCRKKLNNHTFAVGIMGEFKRGKSTVINSLLEQEIMPADILPCSATMNRVTYDMTPHAQLKMRDGTVKDIPVEQLSDYVTKLTGENESRAAEVDEAVVYYPCRFCRNGVDIIDTPGLNDDERMNKISEQVIPKLDAVVMVITPDNPFSMSEAEFVRNKLMTSDLSRLIFLVNKIDQVRRASDRERVVKSIRQKIQLSVMEKTADLYGKDSQEYQDAMAKIGSIRVYPFSALDALDGKLEGDEELIEKSGTKVFEEALTKMLTQERGALELGYPLNAIQRSCSEVAKAAVARKQALELSTEEFKDNQQEALQQIEQLRKQKQEEQKRLQASSLRTRDELEQQVASFYPTIKEQLMEKIDQEAELLDLSTLNKKAGQEAALQQLQQAATKEMENVMARVSEKIQVLLEQQVGKEMLQIGEFMDRLSVDLSQIQFGVAQKSGIFGVADIAAVGAETAAAYAFGGFGVGGLIAGYKSAGIKGALVGGGIGLVGSILIGSLFASMSIVGLPLAILAAASGTLCGKFATNLIFAKDIGQKRLNEIKKVLEENIDQIISQMRQRRDLENWASSLVNTRFEELIQGMEDECERLLKDTEASIEAIKQDLTENQIRRRQMEAKYDSYLEDVKRISEDLEPIVNKVRQVLESA